MPRRKARGRRRGRPSTLERLSVSDLMSEINRRKSMMSRLVADQHRLQSELDAINAEIAGLELLGANPGLIMKRGPGRPRTSSPAVKASGRRAGRGGNAHSLPIALHHLLQGRTMGVTEISEAVQKAGYKTKSPNFRTIVNATLIAKANAGLFRKVARGRYTAK